MNQSVAPTSFITSISRRRANSDSRIVLPISTIEASVSSAASSAAVIVTKRVTVSSFAVSSVWLETFPIDASMKFPVPPGAEPLIAARTWSASPGFDG